MESEESTILSLASSLLIMESETFLSSIKDSFFTSSLLSIIESITFSFLGSKSELVFNSCELSETSLEFL